jgi:opacity protein-like surface antigen
MKINRRFVGMLMGVIGAVAFCPAMNAQSDQRFSVGVNAGGGAITWMSQTWRAGFELGYRLNGHLAAVADASFGALTLENSSSSGSYNSSDSQKWTILPLTLSLLYIESLSDRATAHLGAGIGYHIFTRTIVSETNIFGDVQEESQKSSFHALAPQVALGLEFALGKSLSLKGALTYVFGTISRQETFSNLDTRQDINFGGASVTLGLRLYLF